jgi:pimeloyl-ACP methyl ester carboxylesterase
VSVEAATEIKPFQVEFAEEQLDDLRRRIAATRWPSRELVADRSQGVQLATLQALARYWTSDYDFGRLAARLNALPQFTTEIDGETIHFVHVRSHDDDALPVIITHGWPGSVVELLDVVEPLTDAFHLVLPSLPGYGFSSEPAEVGWDQARIARAWAELMRRLGYSRYVAQGGDQGAGVTDAMARQAPDGLVGIHLNFLRRPPLDVAAAVFGTAPAPKLSGDEQVAFDAFRTQFRKGYIAEQSQSPQTIGFSLTDTPIGLAAWMLDHDADSHAKISRAFLDGQPAGHLTRDSVLDNITLYWLTGTATSAARLYWEGARSTAAAAAAGRTPSEVQIPVAFTVFPGEIFRAPRPWAEKVYPNLIYWGEADRGGHFAAWEEPEIFAAEMRAAFRPLR